MVHQNILSEEAIADRRSHLSLEATLEVGQIPVIPTEVLGRMNAIRLNVTYVRPGTEESFHARFVVNPKPADAGKSLNGDAGCLTLSGDRYAEPRKSFREAYNNQIYNAKTLEMVCNPDGITSDHDIEFWNKAADWSSAQKFEYMTQALSGYFTAQGKKVTQVDLSSAVDARLAEIEQKIMKDNDGRTVLESEDYVLLARFNSVVQVGACFVAGAYKGAMNGSGHDVNSWLLPGTIVEASVTSGVAKYFQEKNKGYLNIAIESIVKTAFGVKSNTSSPEVKGVTEAVTGLVGYTVVAIIGYGIGYIGAKVFS
ncbi:hypothetical protein HZB02_06960 [Candidatus Woesearchaeota archaeon]|nr:hypothetical protein [Candidatus Woesearchaeota archaeon]